MARPRKPKGTETTSNNKLLEAITFLSTITKDQGTLNETHILLYNNCAVAFNGILAAGQRIEENIFAAPYNSSLAEALSKCGQNLSIVQLDGYKLSIKSDKFKAFVKCIDPYLLTPGIPDNAIAPIDDRFREGLEAVSVLASDDAQLVYLTSVLMNGHSLIGTNGKMIFEYWHGIDLPPGLALPKTLAQTLSKIKKKLYKFGYSSSSITLYFEDDSWIKTQLMADPWPDVMPILNSRSNPFPFPESFWAGLNAVQGFSQDGWIHFDKDIMRSHISGDVGASYECLGLPRGPTFVAKQLALIKPHAETVDFFAPGINHGNTHLMFYGKSMRGCIAGKAN